MSKIRRRFFAGKLLVWVLMATLWGAGTETPFAQAATVDAPPILRIEAGMHTSPINRIALDDQGRWLVTASHDKTARVWEPATTWMVKLSPDYYCFAVYAPP